MSKEKEQLKIQTTISKKFDSFFRRHAYILRLKNNELLELYQQAYLRELERDKEERKIKNELVENGKVECPRCGTVVNKLIDN